MKSETRANLIFLAIFLAVSAPGVTILLTRTFKAGGREGAMRRPVRGEWAYMDPTPGVHVGPRVTPPQVGRFVGGIARDLVTMQPGLASLVTSPDFKAVVSRNLHLQLLAHGAHDDAYRVAMIAWGSRFAPLPSLYTFTGTRGDATVNGQMTAYETKNMPLEIRKELQNYGYIIPPDGLMWLIVTFPGTEPIEQVQMLYRFEGTETRDTLVVPSLKAPPATQP